MKQMQEIENEFYTKAKAAARKCARRMKSVDWCAEGGRVKTIIGSGAKRIVAVWNGGRKGKIVIGVSALFLLLMLRSCLSGSSASPAFDFQEDDFERESKTDQMFYAKGEDDGLKEVSPNLRKLPSALKAEYMLCGSFNPKLELERHKKGWAYYNDADHPLGWCCRVIHVGDGWVVAEPNDMSMYGEFFGYIETDDTYVEGQNLNSGFYAFVGTQKVPLINGSSKTMHAFVKIPEKANRLAVEAVKYNMAAQEAARNENANRSIKRGYYEELPAIIKLLEFREFSDKVHVPKGCGGMRKCLKLLSGDTLDFRNEIVKIGDLKRAASRGDVGYFYELLKRTTGSASNLQSDIQNAGIYIELTELPSSYKVVVVEKLINNLIRIIPESDKQRVGYASEFYFYEDSPEFEKAIIDFSPEKFLDIWHTKYKE